MKLDPDKLKKVTETELIDMLDLILAEIKRRRDMLGRYVAE